jgi:uncharacterized protein (TIGR02722 family)
MTRMCPQGEMSRVRIQRPARSAAAVVLAALLLAACGGKEVTRIDPNTTVDLSGTWNDTDSRLVSEQMVGKILQAPWLYRYQAQHDPGARPTVIVGRILNRSTEFIATETFTKDIERAFVNSGQVRLVASSEEREQVRDERRDQQDWADPATVKRIGRELGADYMLMGTFNSITDQEGGDKVIFYQVDLELTDIETNEKVWLEQKEIKKLVGRGKYKG